MPSPWRKGGGPCGEEHHHRADNPCQTPFSPIFNNPLCSERGTGPCWGCGCPGMAGWGPFTDGGAEAQGRPARGRLSSKQMQTLQQTLVLSGFPARKRGCGGGRVLPLAILSLRCRSPREGLGAWSPDPSTHPSSTGASLGGC